MEPSPLFLMCNWLNSGASGTQREADAAFVRYYRVVATHLRRRLRYYLHKSDVSADDVIQDIMMSHLHYLKDTRLNNAKRIHVLIKSLPPVAADDLAARRANLWGQDLAAWVTRAMHVHEHAASGQDVLEHEVLASIQARLTLQMNGLRCIAQLVDNSKIWQEWASSADVDLTVRNEFDIATARVLYHELAKADWRKVDSVDHALQENGHGEYALMLVEMICLSSEMRLPTMADLYKMAYWYAIDALRGQPRQWVSLDDDANNSDLLVSEIEFNLPDETWRQDCYRILKQALGEAEQGVKKATSKQELVRATRKLERAVKYYHFLQNVMELVAEGFTETEIASHLAMSRDAVRYGKAKLKELLHGYFTS